MSSFSEMIKNEKTVLVDFHAIWCGPCKMLAPVLVQLKESLGDKVKIIKIDVDKNPHAAQAYQVSGVPTLVLFSDGRQVWRQSGAMQLQQLKSVVEKYLN